MEWYIELLSFLCSYIYLHLHSFSMGFISDIDSFVIVLDGCKHPKHTFGCRLCKEEDMKTHFLKDDLYGRNLVKHLSLKHGREREFKRRKTCDSASITTSPSASSTKSVQQTLFSNHEWQVVQKHVGSTKRMREEVCAVLHCCRNLTLCAFSIKRVIFTPHSRELLHRDR